MSKPADLHNTLTTLANDVEWCVEPKLLSGAIVDRSRQNRAVDDARRCIEAQLLDLIGPNEPVDGFSKDPNRSIRPAARNEVREELRAKVKAWVGGEV